MKKIKREKPYKKRGFPFGIFLMLFTVEFVIASAAVTFYHKKSVIDTINEVEKYTIGYSLTLAEAFADTAAQSYRAKNYSSLKSLFREKISENLIDEAMFVLNDGSLIAHSIREREKELAGNIAADGMAYNVDLILGPSRDKKEKAVISPYNIIEKSLPFTREQRSFIREHIYKEINITGWLVSRAVFFRNKPVGTVNLIVSRDRIHNVMYSHIDALQRWILVTLWVSLGVSFLVSVIVFIRQRSIENRALRYSAAFPGIYSSEEDILIDLESSFDETAAAYSRAGAAEKAADYKEAADETPEKTEEPVTIEILADFDHEINETHRPGFHGRDRSISPEEGRVSTGGKQAAPARRIIRDAVPVTGPEMTIDTH